MHHLLLFIEVKKNLILESSYYIFEALITSGVTMKIVLNLIKILLFILILYILTQNSNQYVQISLLTYQNPKVSLLVVLIASLTIGAVVGAVFMAFSLIQANSEVKKLKQKNKQLMSELENLRNVSVEEIPDEDVPSLSSPTTSETDEKS
ncbi:MAG: LapA family protein [Calditrichaeota bacterium]|nr:MAG: LapA family protein [Calditrichota bacterium]